MTGREEKVFRLQNWCTIFEEESSTNKRKRFEVKQEMSPVEEELYDEEDEYPRRRHRRRKLLKEKSNHETRRKNRLYSKTTRHLLKLSIGTSLLLVLLLVLNLQILNIKCNTIFNHHQSRSKRSSAAGELALEPVPVPLELVASSSTIASGSKNEPPSRPSVDWSKQKPYFGPDMTRNVSVELGKTAYLTCKVYELGDKTVLWLRPRENEILTAGRFTYIGDSRFASINDNGSHDWILEIKDVSLNDSTSYECQVSTDPKMSTIINLHVKAAKAKIKQGEHLYVPLNSNIEFTCELGQQKSSSTNGKVTSHPPTFHSSASSSGGGGSGGSLQQTYWYFNGNLLNYARTQHSWSENKNFTIEWDPIFQVSRFKLFNVQTSDVGNYTCKPTSSEPATIRLHLKRYNKNGVSKEGRAGYYNSISANQASFQTSKEPQRNRQHFNPDLGGIGIDMIESSATSSLLNLSLSQMFYQILFLISVTLAITTTIALNPIHPTNHRHHP